MGEKIKEKTLFEGELPAAEVENAESATSALKTVKVRPTLTGMEVGDEVSFPVLQLKSVRAQASELGLIHARRYQTRVDKQARVVTVTRTA